jgi:hypothetical protein
MERIGGVDNVMSLWSGSGTVPINLTLSSDVTVERKQMSKNRKMVSIETVLADLRRIKERVWKILAKKVPKGGDWDVGGKRDSAKKALTTRVNERQARRGKAARHEKAERGIINAENWGHCEGFEGKIRVRGGWRRLSRERILGKELRGRGEGLQIGVGGSRRRRR